MNKKDHDKSGKGLSAIQRNEKDWLSLASQEKADKDFLLEREDLFDDENTKKD